MLCQVCAGATALFKCCSILQPRKWQPLPPSHLAKLGHALSIHLFLQVAALCQGPQLPILCYCHPHQHDFISRTDVHSPKFYPNRDSFSPAWGLPSLDRSALLSSPLSAPPATKAGPLVISPALPSYQQRLLRGFKVDSSSTSKSFLLIMCCWFSDYKN